MDSVSDLFSRIKNAIQRRKESLELPASRLVSEIARVLQEEGYISKFEVLTRGKRKLLRIILKYGLDKYGKPRHSAILGLVRVSRPGARIYKGVAKIPRIQGGFGTAILSTPAGITTDTEARKKKVGGEVLAYVW